MSSGRKLVDTREASNPAARWVLRAVADGHYQSDYGTRVPIAEAQAAAEAGTRSYTPSELKRLCRLGSGGEHSTLVEVEDATSQQAAHQLSRQGPVTLLNFASARNPGGGFLGGAKAQEEDLCRCGGLYPTLLTQPLYYEFNRDERTPLYSDHIIFSPEVPFFREGSKSAALSEPFLASVITAPAPNARAIAKNQPQLSSRLRETFLRRWENVLAVAKDQNQLVLVLGAWGCGAFRNDAEMVAEAARDVLDSERYRGVFQRVVFAIPSFNPFSAANLDTFRRVFAL